MPLSQRTMSLMTYNIHKGFGVGRVHFMLPAMRDAIATLNPDFVFLQEVQGAHLKCKKNIGNWPNVTQSDYIATPSWPYCVYAKNAIYQVGHHGNAILSKYPFECIDNINLSIIHRASRGVLHTQLFLNNGQTRLHLLCVHLGLFKAERAAQCNMLISRIRDAIPENDPVLMAGDFNDWRSHLSKPLEDALGMQEAFLTLEGKHARSFPALRPSLRVDRVYFRGVRVSDVQCLEGKPWRTLSDHIPLFARFELPL